MMCVLVVPVVHWPWALSLLPSSSILCMYGLFSSFSSTSPAKMFSNSFRDVQRHIQRWRRSSSRRLACSLPWTRWECKAATEAGRYFELENGTTTVTSGNINRELAIQCTCLNLIPWTADPGKIQVRSRYLRVRAQPDPLPGRHATLVWWTHLQK